MHIAGIKKNTLLDYPGIVAATVFTGGCDLRCIFCQNKELVLNPPRIQEEEVLSFLKKRQGLIKGVCITGGEPTVQEDLSEFIKKVRDLGYKVKLDTNGTRPEVLKKMIKEGLMDYIAMDIKSDKEHYLKICGADKRGISLIDDISNSIRLITDSGIEYEFRTTVIKEYYNEEIAENVAVWLSGASRYVLQGFVDSKTVLGGEGVLHECSRKEMEGYADIVRKYIPEVGLRGVE